MLILYELVWGLPSIGRVQFSLAPKAVLWLPLISFVLVLSCDRGTRIMDIVLYKVFLNIN